MFTGIVTDIGEVQRGHGRAPTICAVSTSPAAIDAASIALGASIACSGICLTVVDIGARRPHLVCGRCRARRPCGSPRPDAGAPARRSISSARCKMGDELGGHMVSGHVDGLAELMAREDMTDQARFMLRAPKDLSRFIAPKGSVALDGVSLTVNEVEDDNFSVLIIPHTLQVTTFGALKKGDQLNLEVDLMARYAARFWPPHNTLLLNHQFSSCSFFVLTLKSLQFRVACLIRFHEA